MGILKFLYVKLLFLPFLSTHTNTNRELNLNIFVHGTIKPYLKVRNIATIINQTHILNSPYASYNNFMRKSNFLRKYQALQGLGLKKIDFEKDKTGNGALAIAYMHKFFDESKTNNKFYTFGWSGLLSYSLREHTGFQLYSEIKKLIDKFKVKGFNPRVNIFTYSHGGNVALNMAKVHKNEFTINKLIMLGLPVQQDTDYLINNSLFEKVYHFYSNSDYVQTVDHASGQYFSCHRKFHPRKNFSMPTKLVQIEIGVIKTVLSQYHKKKCPPKNLLIKKSYHQNPGHGELWILGWSPSGYRKDYPIYPLPVVAFAPLLIKYIDEINPAKNLEIDINPTEEKIIIKTAQGTYLKSFNEFKRFLKIKDKFIAQFSPETDLKELKSTTKKAAKSYSFFKHDPCKCNTHPTN